MGILSFIKQIAPLSLYVTAILFALRGISGNGRWAILLAVFLIPLHNIIDKMHTFTLGTQLVNILLLAALIGAGVECLTRQKPFFIPSFFNVVIFILVCYMFFSLQVGNNYLNTPLTLDDDRTKDLKNFCLMPLLFLLTANQMTDRVWINRVLIVMLCSMGIMTYYTVAQIHDFASIISRDKIRGTFQYLGPNEVAAFYCQYTIIIMSVIFFIRQKSWRLLLFLLVSVNFYCILLLCSRGAYLSMLVGMLVLFFVRAKKLLIPLVLLAVFWQALLPEKVIARIQQSENAYGQLDESAQGRLIIWQQSIDLFKSSPWIGIGFGVFRHLGLILGDTHNIYLKILVEQGVIGFLIFCFIIIYFLRTGFVLYKKSDDTLYRGLGLGFVSCIIVVLVNSFFGDRWTYLELSSYLWVFAGMAARLIYDKK